MFKVCTWTGLNMELHNLIVLQLQNIIHIYNSVRFGQNWEIEQQKNIQFNSSLVVSHVSATMATANFRMCFLKNIKKKTQY